MAKIQKGNLLVVSLYFVFTIGLLLGFAAGVSENDDDGSQSIRKIISFGPQAESDFHRLLLLAGNTSTENSTLLQPNSTIAPTVGTNASVAPTVSTSNMTSMAPSAAPTQVNTTTFAPTAINSTTDAPTVLATTIAPTITPATNAPTVTVTTTNVPTVSPTVTSSAPTVMATTSAPTTQQGQYATQTDRGFVIITLACTAVIIGCVCRRGMRQRGSKYASVFENISNRNSGSVIEFRNRAGSSFDVLQPMEISSRDLDVI